jgi:hypothetical protein
MQAIEFSTQILAGAIQLPPQYNSFSNVQARVIVLIEEPKISQKERLRLLFERMAGEKMFENIENPTAWQKKMRSDEWD